MAQKYELKVVAYLILGLPEDRLEQMLHDIIFLASQRTLIGASIFYPPPGTATYQNCLARGYIRQGEYATLRSTAIPVETPYFGRSDLITLFRLTRIINYLKRIIDDRLTQNENLMDYLQHQQLQLADATNLIFPNKLSAYEIGVLLLQQLFINGKLLGMKFNWKKKGEFHYEWLTYVHTPELIARFLQLLSGKTIRGVKTERFVKI